MEDFIHAHPGVVDASSVEYLSSRRIGIIVRRGNPRGIKSVTDLSAPGIKLLDVTLENMDGPRGLGAKANIHTTVTSGEEGFKTWNAVPELDAWVTYETWHRQLSAGETFIPLEGPLGVRRTPIARTCSAQSPDLAREFISFLKTEEARALFRSYGYE